MVSPWAPSRCSRIRTFCSSSRLRCLTAVSSVTRLSWLSRSRSRGWLIGRLRLIAAENHPLRSSWRHERDEAGCDGDRWCRSEFGHQVVHVLHAVLLIACVHLDPLTHHPAYQASARREACPWRRPPLRWFCSRAHRPGHPLTARRCRSLGLLFINLPPKFPKRGFVSFRGENNEVCLTCEFGTRTRTESGTHRLLATQRGWKAADSRPVCCTRTRA